MRKRSKTTMQASHSEKLHRRVEQPAYESKKNSLGHTSQIEKKQERDEDSLHNTKTLEVFLKGELYVTLCPPKKKKGSTKQKNVELRGDGIAISDGKHESFYPLNSFCMIKQEENTKNSARSPRLTASAPKQKSGGGGEIKTMLICTQDLTRIWIRFKDRSEFAKWLLCIDGLLVAFFSSSLLNGVTKTLLLRERYLHSYQGGSVKVGDDEEWTYMGNSGRLSCSLTAREDLKGASFTFDGQFLRPNVESSSDEFCGEWDGMNIFWYTNDVNGELSERKRRTSAAVCYNWNDAKQEFHIIEKNHFVDDTHNTWALTRNFLARTDGMGAGWIQIEGDTPICLAMFLQLFYAHWQAKE